VSGDDNETLTYTALAAGTYYIRVTLFSDTGAAAGNDYDMAIDVAGVDPCVDDGFEENDTRATAAPIDPGSYLDLWVCPTDTNDFYAVTLGAGDELSLDLFFTHAEGDIDVEVQTSAGTVVASGSSADDDESVTYTAAVAGTYYIRVYLFADAGTTPGNVYDMDIGVVHSDPCANDGYEENDTRATASPIVAGSYPDLWVCPTDVDDYFQIDLARGNTINIDLTFTHAEGDIDVQLLNSRGTMVAVSNSTTDNERITFAVRSAGTYYIRVYLYRDTGAVVGNTYDMDVVVM
jgi:hypothetical protein